MLHNLWKEVDSTQNEQTKTFQKESLRKIENQSQENQKTIWVEFAATSCYSMGPRMMKNSFQVGQHLEMGGIHAQWPN